MLNKMFQPPFFRFQELSSEMLRLIQAVGLGAWQVTEECSPGVPQMYKEVLGSNPDNRLVKFILEIRHLSSTPVSLYLLEKESPTAIF